MTAMKTTQVVAQTVDPVNDDPTLDALSDVNINEDAGEQTIDLTGIAAGGGETQVLSITAESDNTNLVLAPTIFTVMVNQVRSPSHLYPTSLALSRLP